MYNWDKAADQRPLATPLEIEPSQVRSDLGVKRLVEAISQSKPPAIVVGSDADCHACWKSLIQLAEKLNCPVFQEAFGARAGFPQDHPPLCWPPTQ